MNMVVEVMHLYQLIKLKQLLSFVKEKF